MSDLTEALPMPDYSGYIAIQGEGIRFGLMTCLRCGAVVMVEPGENRGGEHDLWHDMLTANIELPDLSVDDPVEKIDSKGRHHADNCTFDGGGSKFPVCTCGTWPALKLNDANPAVRIQINRSNFTVRQQRMTGAELRLVPTPAFSDDWDLWLIVPGHDDMLVENDAEVQLADQSSRFFTTPKVISPGKGDADD